MPEDFEELVLEAASENASLGKLLRELQEPRPAGQDCIPWLGETAMKERILRLCARGKIAINLRNLEHLQTHAGEDEESAWRRLRPKLSYTGRQLMKCSLWNPRLCLPLAALLHPCRSHLQAPPIMDRAAISLAVARPTTRTCWWR